MKIDDDTRKSILKKGEKFCKDHWWQPSKGIGHNHGHAFFMRHITDYMYGQSNPNYGNKAEPLVHDSHANKACHGQLLKVKNEGAKIVAVTQPYIHHTLSDQSYHLWLSGLESPWREVFKHDHVRHYAKQDGELCLIGVTHFETDNLSPQLFLNYCQATRYVSENGRSGTWAHLKSLGYPDATCFFAVTHLLPQDDGTYACRYIGNIAHSPVYLDRDAQAVTYLPKFFKGEPNGKYIRKGETVENFGSPLPCNEIWKTDKEEDKQTTCEFHLRLSNAMQIPPHRRIPPKTAFDSYTWDRNGWKEEQLTRVTKVLDEFTQYVGGTE